MRYESTSDESHSVVIIGGGLAGLTAALHLAERGLRPVVLEADPEFAGGRVAGKNSVELTDNTGQKWQFRAEHGIHGLWSQYLNLETMLARHKIAPKLVKADRQEWIHEVRKRIYRCEMGRIVRRSWIPAPFHYVSLFARPTFLNMLTFRDLLLLPWVLLGLLVAVGIDPMAEHKGLEGRMMDELSRHWPPSLRAFVASLGRNGLSAHPETVPLSGFIAFMRFYTLLRRDSQAFSYFTEDSGTALIEPMMRRISELGGEVRLGQRVTSLEKISDCWKVNIADGTAVRTEFLISAMDAPNTAQLLLQSEPTREQAAKLKWPGALETIVIRAWFNIAPPRRAEAGLVSGNFTIDNFFWLHRLQTDVAKWHQETGGSLVEAHIYGPAETVNLPNEVLQIRAISDIQRIYPMLRGQLRHVTVQRNAPTHTLFGIGSVNTHLGTITPWAKLFCCGDWVRHPSPALFLERATVTGIAAANAVLEAIGEKPFDFTPIRPPEPLAKVVENILSGFSRSLADKN